MTVRVFASSPSPRMAYVLHFLSEFFGREFVRTDDPSDADVVYGKAGGARVTIEPAGLLDERGVSQGVEPQIAQHEAGFPVLFPNDSPFRFDLFSAVFYLLSRYEEWGERPTDSYGRYDYRASIAARGGFLDRPLIHEWLAFFSERLFGEALLPPFRFVPTYDIDMAWSYRHKGFARNAGGLLRSLLSRDGKARERLSVLFRGARDPFDCYDFLDELHERTGLQPLYFIHAGNRRNAYDKNIAPGHPAMAALLQRLSAKGVIGLHPSWASGDDPSLLAEEKRSLEDVLQRPVTASRQHYIRLTLPDTYRRLIEAGIRDEYSMGYGSINGFRASVAVPFYWYDLEREEQTVLRLHPFCFMDANSYYEERKSADDMERELFAYEDEVNRWGGNLISIWHNTLLGSSPEFANWARYYKLFVETITSAG
ncbi:polysaccharide deacetylase family protein [Flaviaesturariibacter terrae]